MSKYDFSLNMDTDNSNSLILRNIKPNSKILEIGCAHGRMTKYLKEELKCDVTIVEIDDEAGAVAEKYAEDSFLGHEYGDVENGMWHNLTVDFKFDYVIFADVLEHLKYPELAMQRAIERLSPDGLIFVSIPNIGHNSVLIDLLRGKFEYKETGILDKTHLKFFTHSSLTNFVQSLGLTINKEMNAVNIVENTEFENSYSQLPSEIAQYLQKREHGEVYQFVWQLKKSKIECSIITPVFNKWNFTKSYLEDMSHLDKSKVEIIIVDNGSADGTWEKLNEYKKRMSNLVIVRNETNTGFGKSCNQAYAMAKGAHILFLNNDIRVQKQLNNWIDALITKCDDNSIVGPTGGKVDPKNDFRFLYETNDPDKDINYMSGWCMMAHRAVWDKLIEDDGISTGPFCKDYFCYFEDTHLSFLAKNMGINFSLQEIPVVHFGKTSSKQLNTHALYTESKKIFCQKWKNS